MRFLLSLLALVAVSWSQHCEPCGRQDWPGVEILCCDAGRL